MFEKHYAVLGIRSPIQKKTVEILGELKGYSKRVTLLKDQLHKDLAKDRISFKGVDIRHSEMISLGLLIEKPGADGLRLALNKNIWGLKLNVIEFVIKVTDHFAKEMRSDTKFQGILTKVKKTIKESERLEEHLSHQTYVILVRCALRKHRDWTLKKGQIIRKGVTNIDHSTPQQELPYDYESQKINLKPDLFTKVLPKDKKPKIPPNVSPSEGFNLRPLNIDLIPSQIESILPESVVDDFGKDCIQYFGDLAVIDVPLSLGRGQKVFISLRRNAVHEKVFWIFSLGGPIEPVQQLVSDIFWHNNECEPFKVTCLEMIGGNYLGVCYVMAIDNNWPEKLPIKIRKLAVFGDRLEELYWRQDEY